MEGSRHVNWNSIIYRKGSIQRTEIGRPVLAVKGFSTKLVQFLNLYHRIMLLLVTCTSSLYVHHFPRARLHQLSSGHNQTPKVASNTQGIAFSSSFIPCKNQRKLLKPGVIFTFNTNECLMENKNMIRTFCGCKSSKTTLSIYWFL